MAQLSPAKKRLARARRRASQAERHTRQTYEQVAPVMRRANVEGQLLRRILVSCTDPFVLSKAEMTGPALGGEIDVSPLPGTDDYEIRYVPTPVEASKKADDAADAADASSAFKPLMVSPAEGVAGSISYAEPEAAV